MKCPKCKTPVELVPTEWPKDRTEPAPELLRCSSATCHDRARYYVWAREGVPGLNGIALVVRVWKYERRRDRDGANALGILITERNYRLALQRSKRQKSTDGEEQVGWSA